MFLFLRCWLFKCGRITTFESCCCLPAQQSLNAKNHKHWDAWRTLLKSTITLYTINVSGLLRVVSYKQKKRGGNKMIWGALLQQQLSLTSAVKSKSWTTSCFTHLHKGLSWFVNLSRPPGKNGAKKMCLLVSDKNQKIWKISGSAWSVL